MKFFINQAVVYKNLLYRVNDIITSTKKDTKYEIIGLGSPVPAYINDEFAGLQLPPDGEKFYVIETELKEYS